MDGEEALSFGGGAGTGAVDGWEAVPPPGTDENGRGWEVVAVGPRSYDDDLSVFPPSRHEGLHPQSQPNPTLPPPRHQAPAVAFLCEQPSPPPSPGGEEGPPQPLRQLLDSTRCFIGSAMEFIHSKLPSRSRRGGGGSSCTGGAFWSFVAAAGLVGALLYLRHRHRREKDVLLFLIQEKDQRISHLLHRIAQMNSVIANRQRVSVLIRI